jgi:hypothetical protein
MARSSSRHLGTGRSAVLPSPKVFAENLVVPGSPVAQLYPLNDEFRPGLEMQGGPVLESDSEIQTVIIDGVGYEIDFPAVKFFIFAPQLGVFLLDSPIDLPVLGRRERSHRSVPNPRDLSLFLIRHRNPPTGNQFAAKPMGSGKISWAGRSRDRGVGTTLSPSTHTGRTWEITRRAVSGA